MAALGNRLTGPRFRMSQATPPFDTSIAPGPPPNVTKPHVTGPRRIAAVALSLGVVFTTAASLAPIGGQWHWWPGLFVHFRPQYVIAFALLALGLLAQRRWTWAILALAGGGASLALMLSLAGARLSLAQVPEGSRAIRLVSVNVLQGNEQLHTLEEFIGKSDADVLVFQEVTPDTAEMLRKLAPLYPGQHLRPKTNSKGVALLTRLPLKTARWEGAPGEESIGVLIGEMDGPAGPFTVLNIHSHKPTSAKGAQSQGKYFAWLASHVAAQQKNGRPVLVAGDFNATPWSGAYQQFAANPALTNVNRGLLFDATWSRWLPQRLLIDHIFFSPEWQLARREVGPAVGSDHRPVIVDLLRTR